MEHDFRATENDSDRYNRLNKEFTDKTTPLKQFARGVMRKGFTELLSLLDAFVTDLKSADPVKASAAFETAMRKAHSLQAGVEAARKIKLHATTSQTHAVLHNGKSLTLDNAVQSLYMIGSAMRENQNTVIGKPQIEDKEMVSTVTALIAKNREALEHAMEVDQQEWERTSSKAS